MKIDISYLNINGVFDIERYLNNNNIDPTDITSFYCHNNQIEKIKGLDKLVNLKRLDCDDNQIEKLEGLDKLVNLEYLYCHNNKITKLEGLDKLVNLEWLWCSDNPIKDLTEIKKLSKKITVIY